VTGFGEGGSPGRLRVVDADFEGDAFEAWRGVGVASARSCIVHGYVSDTRHWKVGTEGKVIKRQEKKERRKRDEVMER
jgi:hypothetical protein